ncbi:nuclear transport factor 2 family protein [Carboxylicivirga marina]|uniref:nuclear transport factor 2 family protein n=1 Tax=Carboxylicivirga marina TaxID=2800988 RepID=UPI0025984E16|nr:nuclear transport factor 2 family protein [uncultured Carboxylicivirga sp.]
MRTITLLLLLITLGTATAQTLSKDELAIKQVIEKETEYFSNGNYDAWSSLWEHSNTIFWAYYSSDSKKELTTWDDLSSFLKETIKNNAENPPALAEKSDYSFYVNKNIALVTFLEGENKSTRVLVKNRGDWKILQMTVSNTTSYKLSESINLLRSNIGKWQIDNSTFKADNWNNTIVGFYGHIKENDGVFSLIFTGTVKTQDNRLLEFKSEGTIGFDFESGEISATVHSIGENYYKVFGGTGELNNRMLEISYYPILKPKVLDSNSIWVFNEDGTIGCIDKYFDKDEKVVSTFEYTLVRQ